MSAQQVMPASSHPQLKGDAAVAKTAAPAHLAQQLMLQSLPHPHHKTSVQSADNAASSRPVAVSFHTLGNSVTLELTPVTDSILPAKAAPFLLDSVNVENSMSVHGPAERSAPHATGASGMQTASNLSERDNGNETPTGDSQGPPLLDTQGPPHTQVHT